MNALCSAAVRWFLPYARDMAPREACGFIVNMGGHARVQVVPNVYPAPGGFEMLPEDVAHMLTTYQCLALVHSHVGEDARPSPADIAISRALDLPHVVVSVDDGSASISYPPGWTQPLLGREWVYGISDCYTLVRDAFQELAGINLPDFERAPFPSPTWDMFARHYRDAGFIEASGPYRQMDVVLFALDDDTANLNHCGIVLPPVHLMHHAFGRLSTREVFSDFWRQHVRLHLRHQTRT